MIQLNRGDRFQWCRPCYAHGVRAQRNRLMVAGPLAGLCAGFLLVGSAALAAGDVPAKPASGPAAQDQELDGLLLRIEQQISDGHTFAPANDNALDTWPRVVQGALPPSPQARRAIADFVTRMR